MTRRSILIFVALFLGAVGAFLYPKGKGEPYVFERQWGLGGDAPGWLDLPQDVAVDGEGNVAVADFHNERIQRFDGQGKFLGVLAAYGPALGEVKYPRALAFDRSGDLYVFEQGNGGRVQKFDPKGRPLLAFSKKGAGPSAFQGAADLTVASDGMIYVAEPGSSWVEVFSPDGKFLRRWGGAGTAPGRFAGLFGIASDGSGHLFTSEVDNARVQKFDLQGRSLACWGKAGHGKGEFDHPNKLACDGAGDLFVADSWNHRVQVFDPQGRWLASFGGHGKGKGELDTPYGIAVDEKGRVFLADTGNDRVVVFRHRFLGWF